MASGEVFFTPSEVSNFQIVVSKKVVTSLINYYKISLKYKES